MDDRERWLVDVARDIRRYWRDRHTGRIGANQIVLLQRSLDRALANYGDEPPCHDDDRREWANELVDRR